ncbi:hypothetical protein AB832_03650 [Flavobacteriaceae bacterium (ex Bugula neritina AB1)]|nr:hypothetical protein AB832_03650 [Flavobacteriaceae bacterium (ex Bugula neritina AB1)]
MKFYICTTFLILSTVHTSLWSQISKELIGFEYSVTPDIGEISIEKYQISTNLGKKTSKGMIGFGISYTFHNYNYNNANINLDPWTYKTIHSIKSTISYRHYFNKSWMGNLVFSPVLSSNFESEISHEDIFLNAYFTISKRWKKKNEYSIFTMGIGYGTLLGKQQFIPIINYENVINKQWSYKLGFPKTRLQYLVNNRNKLSATLEFDGLFANNSSTVAFPETKYLTDTKIQYNNLNLGIYNEYKIQPNWVTTFHLGYTLWNQLKILDQDFNEIHNFETNGSVFINMGLKFNLKNKNNEHKK